MPKALTNIKVGLEEGKVQHFEPGDNVTGLSKEQMAELEAAGAVEASSKQTKSSSSDDSGDAPKGSSNTGQGSGSSGGSSSDS